MTGENPASCRRPPPHAAHRLRPFFILVLLAPDSDSPSAFSVVLLQNPAGDRGPGSGNGDSPPDQGLPADSPFASMLPANGKRCLPFRLAPPKAESYSAGGCADVAGSGSVPISPNYRPAGRPRKNEIGRLILDS